MIDGRVESAYYYMIREPNISLINQNVCLCQWFWQKVIVFFYLFLSIFTRIIISMLFFLCCLFQASNIQIFDVVNNTIFLKNFFKFNFLIGFLLIDMLDSIDWNLSLDLNFQFVGGSFTCWRQKCSELSPGIFSSTLNFSEHIVATSLGIVSVRCPTPTPTPPFMFPETVSILIYHKQILDFLC